MHAQPTSMQIPLSLVAILASCLEHGDHAAVHAVLTLTQTASWLAQTSASCSALGVLAPDLVMPTHR
jgi:hypothetical protein